MMETITMKAEIKAAKLKIKFWSKLARYSGEKALESIRDLDEMKKEVKDCYPELIELVR